MKVGFIGCGKMGGAVLAGALDAGVFAAEDVMVAVRSPESMNRVIAEYGVKATMDVMDLSECEVIVLAIKPQQLNDLLFAPANGELIISLLAGTKLEKLKHKYPQCKVVRTMPNLAHAVGMGATAIYWGDDEFSVEQKELVRELFVAAGEIFEVKKEESIDTFGATGGTGPAYFAAMLGGIASAAEKRGFDAEEADRLARQTFLGAAKLMHENSDISFKQWITNVCSPGGTTEQAMRVYREEGLEKMVDDAVSASVARANELGAK